MSAIDGRNPALKRQKIPPVNTDFLTQIQSKSPHLVEPMRILTAKMNDVINHLNEAQAFHLRVLLKNLKIAKDVADHIPVRIRGTALAVHVVLRKPITKDLKFVINCYAPSFQGALMKIVIPKTTKTSDTVSIVQPVLAKAGDMATLSFDILDSDEQKDVNGVVSITGEWTS